MTVPRKLLTIQPVAVPGRPTKNIQLEVLEFIAKYRALTNGKTPGARLTAHALKPAVSVSHRKVLATVKDLEKGGLVRRVGNEILVTADGDALLAQRGAKPGCACAGEPLLADVEGEYHS